MKKLVFALVAAMMAATASYAQSSLLATLSHDGNITTYYGASALQAAHTAAANGDIITLSSGSFNAVNITKGVTIRGAGWEVDSISHSEPTVISGDFTINIPTGTTERLTIEGIYHNGTITYNGTLTNATFLKSRFYKISYNSSSYLKNAAFIHCRVADGLNLNSSSSASCVNCVINNPYLYSSSTSNLDCLNSIIIKSYFNGLTSSSFKNCILYSKEGYSSSNYFLPSTSSAFNCVGFTPNEFGLFNNVGNNTNTRLKSSEVNSVFKTFNGSYSDSENFQLTDDAKTKYLGIDGTQVGIYGGSLPFSSTPTNPQITKCNVASKSTADGKLSVEIEVSSVE